MDEARFRGLVEFAKAQLASPAVVYKNRLDEIGDLISQAPAIRAAWDSCCEIARELLRDGKPLPGDLAQWVAGVLDDLTNPPATTPRPPKRTDAARKRVVLSLMIYNFAERFELKPTRGTGLSRCCAAGGSACDVVGAAAGLNYKHAERIWTERDPILQIQKKV